MGYAVCAAIALCGPTAKAQTVTVEELSRRLDAAEAENRKLREEVERLAASMRTQAPQQAQAAASAEPSAMPVPRSSANSVKAASDERWDGSYAGISAGVHRTTHVFTLKTDFSNYNSPSYDQPYDRINGIFGFQAGHRWQSGPGVIGIELQGQFPRGAAVSKPTTYSREPITRDAQFAAAVKAQIGWADGPFLAYATGGIQVTRVSIAKPRDQAGSASYSNFELAGDDDMVGLIAGVGIGYHLSDALSLEIEATNASMKEQADYREYANHPLTLRTVVARLNTQF